MYMIISVMFECICYIEHVCFLFVFFFFHWCVALEHLFVRDSRQSIANPPDRLLNLQIYIWIFIFHCQKFTGSLISNRHTIVMISISIVSKTNKYAHRLADLFERIAEVKGVKCGGDGGREWWEGRKQQCDTYLSALSGFIVIVKGGILFYRLSDFLLL